MAEIENLEAQLREGRAYLQALEDTFKLLPRDGVSGEAGPGEGAFRPGGSMAGTAEEGKDSTKNEAAGHHAS